MPKATLPLAHVFPAPMVQGLGGLHSQSELCGEEKNIFPMPGIEP